MEVYYFSGTGNSLVVAKTIANETNSELYPISNTTSTSKENRICIVFPSYLAASVGSPLAVERFIKNIEAIDKKEMYFVCTCGGYELMNALPSLHKLRKYVQSLGGNVRATYSLRMPMNNQDYDHIPIPINKDIFTINEKAKKKAQKIAKRINISSKTQYRVLKTIFYYLMLPLFLLISLYIKREMLLQSKEPKHTLLSVRELIPLTDRSIKVEEMCSGCGVCAKVCPVHNIKIIDGRPIFQHHCEMCFACDEWCPANAIKHWGRQKGGKYHHPDVKKRDFITL